MCVFQFCFFWCLPVLALQLIRRLEELRQNSKKPFLPKRPSLSYQIVADCVLICLLPILDHFLAWDFLPLSNALDGSDEVFTSPSTKKICCAYIFKMFIMDLGVMVMTMMGDICTILLFNLHYPASAAALLIKVNRMR